MILNYNRIVLLVLATMVTGCGGGGGGGSDAPPSNPDPFSLAVFKTTTPGFTKTFNLTGSDSREDTYQATIAIEIKAPTSVGGKMLTPTVVTINMKYLKRAGSVSSVSITYYKADGTLDHVDHQSIGVICTPKSYEGLPDTATIGQSGTLAVLDCSDSTTETATWRLEASGNDAKYIETYTSRFFGGALEYTEDDVYLINTKGDILALDISYVEPSGYTLTLSGK